MGRQFVRLVVAVAFLGQMFACGGSSTTPPSATQPTPTASCSFAISPATASFTSAGGSQVVNVAATPAGCAPAAWTATTTAGLTLSPSSGTGNGSVTVTAAANGGTTQQTLTATIAGQPFTATVAAIGCTYTFTANAPDVGVDTWTVPPDGSERGVTVTVSPNNGSCAAWSATTAADWIRLTPASGTTSTTVRIDYTSNTAATARSGSISFARPGCTGSNCGLTANVNQSAAAPPPAPSGFALNLTLQQGENLSGPYGGIVTGPNGFSCSIGQFQKSVACPSATFTNGSTVQLVVTLTASEPGDKQIFFAIGCDALTPSTCTLNMNADRTVVIGVGCATCFEPDEISVSALTTESYPGPGGASSLHRRPD